MTHIVLFDAQSLRVHDHLALIAAAKLPGAVIPLFVLDEDADGDVLGGATRWWLHHALIDLDQQLQTLGSRLIIARGPTVDTVAATADTMRANSVFMIRGYSGTEVNNQRQLHERLSPSVTVKRFGGRLLFEPEAIATKEGKPYTVFSPFWKNCQAQDLPARPQPAPATLTAPEIWPDSMSIDALGLLPTTPDWAGGLRDSWAAARAGGLARLDRFKGAVAGRYKADRDRPDKEGTSRLSPYLRFGQLSVGEVYWAVRDAIDGSGAFEVGSFKFISELGWREFAAHLLFHFPHITAAPLRENFSRFPWDTGSGDLFTAWQKGQTGYPIVDAGMRELWHTGWMHNRVRMIVASFLVKDLLWHWRDGERWFWDTLVDADVATNAASWQWAAGCGADAAPYFRIFNPILQGEKFDPKGDYVRRWVPELAHLPAKILHKPWEAPGLVLQEAGVTLGQNYPHPIVDRSAARARALAAFETIKAQPGRLVMDG